MTSATAAADLPSASGSATPARGACILLVDDDALVRRAVARMLLSDGCDVLEASSPAEALELARTEPNASRSWLTEVVMPDTSGVELVERLQRAWSALRVLLRSRHPADGPSESEQAGRCTPLPQEPDGPGRAAGLGEGGNCRPFAEASRRTSSSR